MSKKVRHNIIGAAILVVLIAALTSVYLINRPAVSGGEKDIIVEVTGKDGNVTSYELTTDAEYLIQAMDELTENGSGFSYSGSQGDYGIMIETLNGEKAVFDEKAGWTLYVNGSYGSYGADSQPVSDGDTYNWRYETYD